MPRESISARAQRADEVVRRLGEVMPEARIELAYRTPAELLVAVILSAQCTDQRVNLVTPALFAAFDSVSAFARARPQDVEPFIRTCGLFRSKARSIVGAMRAIDNEHQGQVPLARELLERLPGVGRKTAGVVCIHLGGDDALPVDTHVQRLARRLGLSAGARPDQVEEDLCRWLPRAQWARAHILLVWHGRRCCMARGPACERCPVADLCPRVGVKGRRKPVRRETTRGLPSRPRGRT